MKILHDTYILQFVTDTQSVRVASKEVGLEVLEMLRKIMDKITNKDG
jgi:hypothetical protein